MHVPNKLGQRSGGEIRDMSPSGSPWNGLPDGLVQKVSIPRYFIRGVISIVLEVKVVSAEFSLNK